MTPGSAFRYNSINENAPEGASEEAFTISTRRMMGSVKSYYHSFDRKYAEVPVMNPEVVDGGFMSMREWANMCGITKGAAHQLFRRGLIRGIKVLSSDRAGFCIMIERSSRPPKLKPWRRKALEGEIASRAFEGNGYAPKPASRRSRRSRS